MNKIRLDDNATIQISNIDKNINDNEIPISMCNYVDVYRNYAITHFDKNNLMKATAKITEIEKFSIKKVK